MNLNDVVCWHLYREATTGTAPGFRGIGLRKLSYSRSRIFLLQFLRYFHFTQQLVCLVVEVSLFLELVEASEDDREAEVPVSAVHLDHPRSHGLTTRTAKYIIITICLLLLRYYATIEWCGVFHSVARIRCGSRLVLGGGRAVEQHQSLDTTKAGNEPSRCLKLLGPSPG